MEKIMHAVSESPDFWTKIIGTLLGSFLSGAFAILIFILGGWRDKWRKRKEEKRKLDELEIYFFYSIDYLKARLNKQLELMSDFLGKVHNYENRNLFVGVDKSINIGDLSNMDWADTYKIIVSRKNGIPKEKVHEYKELNASLRYIDDILITVSQLNKDFRIALNDNIEAWNRNIKELNEVHRSYVQLAREQRITQDSFLDLLHQKLVVEQSELSKTGQNQNTEIVYKSLIEPIIKYISEDKSSADTRYFEIFTPLMGCRMEFIKSKEIRNEISAQIKSSFDRLKSALDMLLEYAELIKKRETI